MEELEKISSTFFLENARIKSNVPETGVSTGCVSVQAAYLHAAQPLSSIFIIVVMFILSMSICCGKTEGHLSGGREREMMAETYKSRASKFVFFNIFVNSEQEKQQNKVRKKMPIVE